MSRDIHTIIQGYLLAQQQHDQQRRELQRLRDDEAILLSDARIDELAWLDSADFSEKCDEVRECYSRRDRRRFGPVASLAAGRDEPADVRRAIATATQRGVSFAEAMREVRRGR